MIGDGGPIIRGPVGTGKQVVVSGDIIAEIPVTPIACLFSILYILVVAMQIWPGGPPGFQKELLKPHDVAGEIRVIIDRSSEITINGTHVMGDGVYGVMDSTLTQHRTKHLSAHIVVLADSRAAWQSAMTVLDAARQAGDDDVELRRPVRGPLPTYSIRGGRGGRAEARPLLQ